MKIWIDLANSPHVNFFAGIIEELQAEHEVLLTCRPLANTIDILQIKGFPYHVVGKHYGANRVKKVLGFLWRVFQLYLFLRKRKPDVAISQSSYYSPIVARLLGVRSIYLNDNEHAAGNKISFLFANTIMVPECLGLEKVQRQWGRRSKVLHYPGVKEAVYLWRNGRRTLGPRAPSADSAKRIYIRPEPWAAHYYRGEKNFMDQLVADLKHRFSVVLLPRGDRQKEHYQAEEFAGIVVLDKAIELAAIMDKCDLFIGAGGTMTREAAVLGIPTISVYRGDLLNVDKYLIAERRMIHKIDLVADFVVSFLENHHKRSASDDLLAKGREAHNLIKRILLAPAETPQTTRLKERRDQQEDGQPPRRAA